jgi:hypothetical protein
MKVNADALAHHRPALKGGKIRIILKKGRLPSTPKTDRKSMTKTA